MIETAHNVGECARHGCFSGSVIVASKDKNGFFMRLVKGAIIGVTAILPGASGGVLAVAMGVYRPVIDAAVNFFKTPKRSIFYLLPLGIGGALGLLLTSRLVEWLMVNHETPVMYLLIGLVAGGVPSLVGEANEKGFKKRYLIAALCGFLLITALALADRLLSGGTTLPFNGWAAALCGALIALGTVIPGISTSFILMYLGIYEPMLGALNSFNIPMLLCAGAGGAVTILLTISIVKRMFDRFHGYAYYAVLGLLFGSILLIFPGVSFSLEQLLCTVLCAIGFMASYLLCKNPDKGEKQPS